MLTKTHGILEIIFCFCWKPTNNICSNGDTRNSMKQNTDKYYYKEQVSFRMYEYSV